MHSQKQTNPQLNMQQHVVASLQAPSNATPFMEFEADDIAINTGGKSTQTKKIQDFTDLKSFKNAQKSIKAVAATATQGADQLSGHNNATTSSHSGTAGAPGKKNQGVTGQNMQNMINSEGPMIMGPADFMHSTQNLVAKTNPTSMRDKFKMENPGKKILTPRGGGQHAVGVASNSASKGLHNQQVSNLMQRQNFHEIDAYSSEQISGRGAGTTGTLSIKHHESISGLSGSAVTTKGKAGKRQGVMTTTLSEIDKKHMGMPSSGQSATTAAVVTTSKKHHHNAGQATCTSSSKNSAGRGAGGSIDLLSGVTSLSQIKSKSIHGQKVSEVTVQSNQVIKQQQHLQHSGANAATSVGGNHNHQQTPSFHSTTMTSKQQFSLNSNKQGSLLSAMIQTPQKFRVKNTTHQSAKKGGVLKNQHAQSMGPSADSCSTSVNNRGHQPTHHGGSTVYNQRDSFENQRLVTAAKSQPGSSGGTANRKGQQLLSTNLSKVTSEKKLTGVAGSTLSDAASHISPRDTTAHGSHSKAESKNSCQGGGSTKLQQQPGGKNSTTGKKVPQPQQSSIQNQINQQQSFMNEYLVESQKNMKQLQQQASSGFQTQTTSHASLVVTSHQREPVQLMSTTLIPAASHAGSQTTTNQQRMMHQTTTGFDLKKKKPSQVSMRQLQGGTNAQQHQLVMAEMAAAEQHSHLHHLHHHHPGGSKKQNVNVVSKTKASRRTGGSQSITQHQQPQALESGDRQHHQLQSINNSKSYHQQIHGSAGVTNYTPVELDTLHTNSVHNKSDLQPASSGALNSRQHEKNLFYKVQDATLCQDQTTDQEMIEYFEDTVDPQPLSAKKSSKKTSHLNQHQSVQHKSKKYANSDVAPAPHHPISDGEDNDEEGVDDDMEGDSVPVIAELVEDDEIFRKPSSPIHQAEGIVEHEHGGAGGGGTALLEDLDGYIEHRNADTERFNINALSGQKTEFYDRQNAKLFKKKVERTHHVKSLLQPSQSNEMDKFIYNARSGGPNQNFNFAKNQIQNHQGVGQRPTSTKQGQKTLTCWTGSLAQANYSSSTKHLGGPITAKNSNTRSITGSNFNNTGSFQKGGLGSQYNKTSQRTAKGGGSTNTTVNNTTTSGAKISQLSHSKNPSQTQKDIYKVQGSGGTANTSKKKTAGQQAQQPQPELANKVTSSSFETRPGSQSMSYIPPRRIQDQSLQLIQVPLSRAELNNQSAYHLADSQYGGGAAGSHHHKSISYCKDDVRSFNRSLQKNSSGQSKNLLKNQGAEKQSQGGGGMYQTSATVTSTLKHVDAQNLPFKSQKTMVIQGPAGSGTQGAIQLSSNNIEAAGGGIASATVHVFSRSQSNQQISTTHNAAVTNTVNGAGKRMTNSQSRGKQRGDHQQAAIHGGGSNVVSPNPNLSNNAAGENSRSLNKQQPRSSDHQVASTAANKKGSSSQGQGQKASSTASQLHSNNMNQTKIARKNQNNLKMSTMQLRDQDFKKITSQIQSQTMTNAAVNAKKKKIQFHQGQTQQIVLSHQKGGTAVGVSSQMPASTTRLNNQPPGSIGHSDQLLELPQQKFISTSKIYSPHRRSIQQVSNPNMGGAYLNPIDGGADVQQQETSSNGGGASGNNYTGSRKFAYSLTDKYKGGGFEEIVWKQPGVYAGSHVSSSDGGASYIIPSENERIESTSKRKDKQQAGVSKGQQKGGNSKRLSNMTGSQANLNQQYAASNTGNNMNMFFPDPSAATFFERKKSSMEQKATGQHTAASQQNIGKSRGSSKHIEQPHRMVKVSKPFAGSQSKKSSLHGGQKAGSSKGGFTTVQQQQSAQIMSNNPNTQKKSGSFGGGYKEPVDIGGAGGPRIQNSGSFTTSSQNNNAGGNNTLSHQVQQQHPSTAPVSHHTTSNQAKIPLDSRCQSPEQPPRKNNALHLNSHGPGSLIANANLIRQQSPNVSSNRQQDGGGSLSGSFTGQQQLQQIGGGHQAQIITAVSTKNATSSNKLYGAKNAAFLAGTKSPGKKVNKKLSHKMQNVGYAGDLSTATKKILTSGTGAGAHKTPAGSSKDSSEHTSKVFKNYTGSTAQHSVLASFHPSQNSLQSTSKNTQQLPLDVHTQPSSLDKPKTQNIQLLRQVHHKQITTASKGKDSGSVQKLQQATNSNGKSFSVLVPSAESVAQSKAILLDSNSTSSAQQSQQVTLVKNTGGAGTAANNSSKDQQRSSLASSTEKERRPGGGSLVIIPSSQQPMVMNNKNHHQNNNRLQKDNASSVAASPVSEKRTPGARSEQHASQTNKKHNIIEQSSDAANKSNTDEDTTILQDQAVSSKKTSFISGKYNGGGNRPLNVIEERLESQDSAVSDPTLSPRSRHILKIQKKIKFAFLKQGTPPETQTENYKIGKVMGKGAFGKVNLAIHRLASKFVALKSINKQFLTQEQSKRKVMQEFNILRRTRHCNIVRLYESFETQQHIVFVMEVCGGGDLLTYVRRRRKLKEDTARFLFKQIVTGLAYCHTKNVLHRDIKLDNILLTSQGDVKICDFGVSKLVTPGERMTEQCGTPAYIAPEVFKNQGYEGFASDIWSAGVVLYAMLFGAVPFKASNMAELHKYVLERQPTYKEEEISQDALTLLKGILEKDPTKRLTSDQILSHPWMLLRKGKSKKVNVFTEQEKEGIISEFEYYNKRERDVIVDGEHQVVPTDPFAEQMLSSAQDSELKNVSTRSIILAPFNSTRSQLVYSQDEEQMMKDMLAPRAAVKFSARVKEIDRQYELNNNADLDNGVYHQDEDEEESKGEQSPPTGSNPPRPTEERPETRARIRAHDEASIADSFNQEQLHSQLDELDEANNSINSAELDEGGRDRNETNYVSPASARPLTSEQMQINKNQNKNDKNEQQQSNNQNKLSEWRKLEKQMIKGDGQSSPPKQSLFNQRIFEEIKGDKAIPDSGDLVLDQSYEQVQIELYDDLAPAGSASNSREGGSTALQVNLQKVTNAAMMSGQNNQQRQTMIIDEASVTEIEKCGYPKPYIMASLNNDDLNHVTTFYYLLQTQKEY